MPSVTRKGDYSSGHRCCFKPVPLVQGSYNVFVNGRGVGREGDKYKEHGGCEMHVPDVDYILRGSSSVYVNRRPIGRVSDRVGNRNVYDSRVAEGSYNVYSGG